MSTCYIDAHAHWHLPAYQTLFDEMPKTPWPAMLAATHLNDAAKLFVMHQAWGVYFGLGFHPYILASDSSHAIAWANRAPRMDSMNHDAWQNWLHRAMQDLGDALVRYQAHAVGEIGLDFSLPPVTHARQIALMNAQLALAHTLHLPIMVHSRQANDQVLSAIKKIGIRHGLIHAFSGSKQQALAFIQQGLHLGFGGAMTYRRATRLQSLAATLPITHILLETDGPDMRPVWQREGPNDPANLMRYYLQFAHLRNLSLTEVQTQMCLNFEACFGLKPIN
jgi:TatD DNase family protein